MDTTKSISISTNKKRLDLKMIHAFLSQRSYWAKGIPLALLKKSIKNSVCFGIYVDSKQVGFARVTSDLSTFAYIADVFILENFRGQGLSNLLMQAIVDYPDFKNLRRWMLMTADAHFLYEKFGFTLAAKPERVMEKFIPNIYVSEAVREVAITLL